MEPSAQLNGVTLLERIEEADVAETIETEICVLGAGAAGTVAALAAAEAGARVVVLQNKKTVVTQGSGACAYGSKRQVDQGLPAGGYRAELQRIKTLQEGGETNGALLGLWFQKSGEVIDWILDHAEPHGITLQFDKVANWDAADEWLRTYPVAGKYNGEAGFGAITLSKILAEQAVSAGAQFIYEVTAKQLERGDDGRVSAVYAVRADDSVLKVQASKGIIICTGGYEGNAELRAKWLPHGQQFNAITKNQGEGILMAMAVGAAVDQPPHSSNIHYNAGANVPFGSGLPWLRVDAAGRRYCNEDAPYGNLPLQDALVENATGYQIFDANMGEQYDAITENGQGLFRTFPGPEAKAEKLRAELGEQAADWHPVRVMYESSAAGGHLFKADTLEELAEVAGFDKDTFLATVARYNELYDLGEDLDFAKDPRRLHPIRTAPFFAVARKAFVLGTLNGLVINENMQVLDEADQPIPGLYAAGNASGGKFFGGLVQSMSAPAMTISRAQVWGYLAAMHAVQQ